MSLLQGATVRTLASHLLSLLGETSAIVVGTSPPSETDVSQLSEEEVDGLLAQLLSQETADTPYVASANS
jgi:hypothetical protein